MGLTQCIADLRWILLILFVVNQQSVIAAAETQKQTCHQAIDGQAAYQIIELSRMATQHLSMVVCDFFDMLDYIHVQVHVVHVAINFVHRAQWRHQTYANHLSQIPGRRQLF